MTFVIFLVILSILVFVHELGHFMMARMLGIRIEEFAFGLPFTGPLLSIKFRETKYSIYPLVFGGFVKLYGEEAEVDKNKKDSYWHRSKLQRMAVVVAGVVMNVVLAFVGFWILYSKVGVPIGSVDKVTVIETQAGSPAQLAGFKAEDRILLVEGKPITSSDQFTALMSSWAGLGVNVTLERGKVLPLFEGPVIQESKRQTIFVTPRVKPPTGQGPLGLVVTTVPYLRVNKCSALEVGCGVGIIKQGVKTTGVWIGRVVDGLRQIGKSLVALKAPEGVSGPIGIYQITGIVAHEGLLPLVELVAVLSINLAVFNILPIPALDGGRALFIGIEAIRRKRLLAEFEQRVNNWGMTALIALVVLITLQDIVRAGIINKILGK